MVYALTGALPGRGGPDAGTRRNRRHLRNCPRTALDTEAHGIRGSVYTESRTGESTETEQTSRAGQREVTAGGGRVLSGVTKTVLKLDSGELVHL